MKYNEMLYWSFFDKNWRYTDMVRLHKNLHLLSYKIGEELIRIIKPLVNRLNMFLEKFIK